MTWSFQGFSAPTFSLVLTFTDILYSFFLSYTGVERGHPWSDSIAWKKRGEGAGFQC